MRKFLSLSKVLLKNNLNFLTDGKTKKAYSYLLYIVLGCVFVPYLYLLYVLFDSYFQAFGQLSQTGTVLAMGFFLCAVLIFVFSIFIIPGIFYFSKDNTTLVALPISPQTILGAKFFNCLLYELAFSIVIIIPLGIAYGNHNALGFFEILSFMIIILTLPILPLIYSTLLTMIVMRFLPFAKHRDTFNLISSILIVVVALGTSFYISSSFSDDPMILMEKLMEGNNSLIPMFSTLFPNVTSACNAILKSNILDMVIYLLWNVGAVALMLTAGRYLYFKGAIGINESSKKSKKINIDQHARQHSKTFSYMKKEFWLLLRTPIYFMNCILSGFIFMIMFFVAALQPQVSDMIKAFPIDDLLSQRDVIWYALMVSFLIGCFLSTVNMISSTAISREGDHASIMKYLPISYASQLYAKAMVGLFWGLLSILPIWLFCILYLKLSFLIAAVTLIGILASAIACNLFCILVDLIHPKLIWEQEAAAVKQNLNGLISMALGMVLALGIGASLFYLPASMISMTASLFLLLLVIIIAVLCCIINKFAGKMFAKIS